MVSNFRYSLPVFIPLILGVFLLGVNRKKAEFLGYLTIGNMISSLSMAYYPKLILISLPLSLLLIWHLNRAEKSQKYPTPALTKVKIKSKGLKKSLNI